jgi:hypothetical protein
MSPQSLAPAVKDRRRAPPRTIAFFPSSANSGAEIKEIIGASARRRQQTHELQKDILRRSAASSVVVYEFS